ncbi:MAG: hypothetical protein ACJ8CR_08085 [Roseiflexaceae bacterium]
MSGETVDKAGRAPLSVKALLAELAGGIVAGLLLSRLGGLAGAALGSSNGSEFGDLIGAVLGIFAGYIVGVAAGLSIAGHLLKQRGSFWLALLGSLLGGVLVALLAEPLRLNQSTAVLSFAVFFVALALALVGYNLRRRA